MNNETVLTDTNNVDLQEKPVENKSSVSPIPDTNDKNLQPKSGKYYYIIYYYYYYY